MRKKRNAILLLCLAALFLAACTDTGAPGAEPTIDIEPAPTAEPTPAPPEYMQGIVSFSVGMGGESYTAKSGWFCEYGGVSYAFASNIDEAGRDAFISELEAVKRCLEKRFGEFGGEYAANVWGYELSPGAVSGVLNAGHTSTGTQDFVTGVAQMLLGEHVNYGLLYALGASVAEELGCPVEDAGASAAEALALYDTQPEYLDLSYACFIGPYANEETQAKVKRLSLELFDYIQREGLMDIYTDYSDGKFCGYMTRYLAENGRGPYDNSDLRGTVFFKPGGEELRVAWENEYAVFYFHDEFYPKYSLESFPADVGNSSYADLRGHAIGTVLQTEFMEGYLGKFIEDKAEKAVVLYKSDVAHEGGAAAQSWYGFPSSEGERLQIYTYYHVFMHEYGHYLLHDISTESMSETGKYLLEEVIVYYLFYLSPDERIGPERKDSALFYEKSRAEDEKYAAFFNALEEYLGHATDFDKYGDFVAAVNAELASALSGDELRNEMIGYPARYVAVSFTDYLVGLAGLEGAIDAMVLDTPMETFGRSWDELVGGWAAYVTEEFAWAKDYPTE